MTKSHVLRCLGIVFLSVFTAFADISFRGTEDRWPVILLKAVVYGVLYIIAFWAAERFYRWSRSRTENRVLDSFFADTKTGIARVALILMAVYMAYLVIYYPGTCGWDTVNQIRDLVTGTEPLAFNWVGEETVEALMNDHHPVFTTLIFTAFYRIGLLLGDAGRGMFLYCVLQSAALSVLAAMILCKMRRFGIPSVIPLMGMVLYAMPFTAYFAISMIKDSLFALVFIAFYMFYILLVRDLMEGQEGNGHDWICLIVFSVLIALCNKKGMYIAFASIIPLLGIAKRWSDRIRVMAAALVPIIVIVVFLNRILFPVFAIYPGGPQEAIGFAFHQTAKARIDYPEDFTDKDNQIFFNVLHIGPEELVEEFDAGKTDSIKDRYSYYATKEDRRAFLRIWARMGMKHPILYLRTSLGVCGGYFAPVKSMNVNTGATYNKHVEAFENPEKLETVRTGMTDWFNWQKNCLPVSTLYTNALYMWWIPLIIAVLLFRHGSARRILMLAPIFANIVFLVLGPVCWTRYGLCQIYTVPLQMGLLYLDRHQ